MSNSWDMSLGGTFLAGLVSRAFGCLLWLAVWVSPFSFWFVRGLLGRFVSPPQWLHFGRKTLFLYVEKQHLGRKIHFEIVQSPPENSFLYLTVLYIFNES